MKKYDFNEIVNRKNSNCLKYDFAVERGKDKDILPFWVADMDFRVADEIVENLQKAVSHGIFGYSDVKDDYADVITGWFLKNFNCKLEKSWLVKTPGVVYALYTAVKAYTEVGDSIIIQKPVYYPFSGAILDNDRKLVNSPLVYNNGKYTIDFEDFEKKVIENNVKMFILCSPHNPVGRVYTESELRKLGDICLKHNVIIVSDEIHCDFTRKGIKHHMFLSLDDKYKNIALMLTAPSKSFNIAGLQCSNIFIPNEQLRNKFKKEVGKSGYSQLNALGLVATKSAYEFGEEWLSQLKEYLEGNLQYIKTFLEDKLPNVKLVEPEGTYLAWLDFSKTGLKDEEIDKLIIEKANLWLDKGTMFGEEGQCFQRINYACQRILLEKCMENLYNTFK